MGAVYEASQVRLEKKRFAVKLLHGWTREDPDVYARFRREAEIVAELDHPNIVDVIDFDETEEGQPYMVMELLHGEDLARRLDREAPLPPDLLLAVMEQVASALQVAHDHGIVHRDIKPENIFLVERGPGAQAKVLDFGISRIKHSKTVQTRADSLLGTPHYMSPEQVEGGAGDVDHTTDIFALGVVCYMALSGVRPFDAPSVPGVIHQVCFAEPEPLEGQPPEVNAVLARALAKERGERYQRVTDLVDELRRALSGQPLAAEARTLLERPARRSRKKEAVQPRTRKPWVLPAVATVSLAALTAAASVGFLVARQPPGPDRSSNPARARVPAAPPATPAAAASRPAPTPTPAAAASRPSSPTAPARAGFDAGKQPSNARTRAKVAARPPAPKIVKPRAPPARPVKVQVLRVFVQGPLDRDAVRAVLRRHIGQVKGCYAAARPIPKRPSGNIYYKLVISPRGAVLDVRIMASLFQIPKAEGCFQSQARRWRFPAPTEGMPASIMVGYAVSYLEP
jgi:serine/threonine-protein kinase